MSQITLPSINAGVAKRSEVIAALQAIVDVVNSDLDNTNIKAGAAIDSSKIDITTPGVPVQIVRTMASSVATGSTTIPNDDSLPQNTEGNEYMTVAITPKSASSILDIEVVALVACSNINNVLGALFQDTTANALAATIERVYVADGNAYLHLFYSMTAGTTSATTFKFRAGPQAAGTLTFNGSAAVRVFNTATKSWMKVTEIRA